MAITPLSHNTRFVELPTNALVIGPGDSRAIASLGLDPSCFSFEDLKAYAQARMDSGRPTSGVLPDGKIYMSPEDAAVLNIIRRRLRRSGWEAFEYVRAKRRQMGDSRLFTEEDQAAVGDLLGSLEEIFA